MTSFGASYFPIIQKFTNSGIPGAVEKENGIIAPDYLFLQNYPNPFNPATDIKFTIAKDGFVTLRVYDVLGKDVAALVNENLSSGSYTTRFSAQNLASGIYIYQLSANGVLLSGKMTLLK